MKKVVEKTKLESAEEKELFNFFFYHLRGLMVTILQMNVEQEK